MLFTGILCGFVAYKAWMFLEKMRLYAMGDEYLDWSGLVAQFL